MICPRCSVAEISPETGRCELCGFTPLGARPVAVQAPVADEVLETVQRELQGRFDLQMLLRRERGSTLYVARDVEDDRLVRLRLIPRQGPVEGPLIHRFAQAGVLAAQFRHPHVVALRKHGITNSLLWYSTDVIKSRALSRMLENQEPMPLVGTLELLEQIASGLEYLHRNAVVHAGIGRETVLVDAEGWVRITDPGTAAAIYRAAGPGHGWEALLDLPFAAPELLERRLMGPAADQYSLAGIAYACLAGRPPFEAATLDDVRRARAGPMPSLRDVRPDLPPYVETAILRALRDEPTERFGSVLDFVAVLSGASLRPSGSMLVPSARPTGAPVVVVPPAPASRRRWWLALGLVAVVAGVAVGGWALSRWQRNGGAGWAEGPAPAPAAAVRPPAAEPAAPRSEPNTATGQPEPPAAQPASPPQRAARPAAVFINATPWGSLYVDGRLIGNTPQANLQLPAGTHVLRIVRDGFVPWEQEITLAAGDTVRITDIVLQPLEP
jgi:serine/threonine-protein kinase